MKDKLNELKERPKEDRRAIAGTIAFLVALFLFLVWFAVFFKDVLRGTPVETAGDPQTDRVDFSSFGEATREFTEVYYDARGEFERFRDEAARAEQRTIEAARQ